MAHVLLEIIIAQYIVLAILVSSVWATAMAQWLRCCATNQKVAGSIPDGVIGIFH